MIDRTDRQTNDRLKVYKCYLANITFEGGETIQYLLSNMAHTNGNYYALGLWVM